MGALLYAPAVKVDYIRSRVVEYDKPFPFLPLRGNFAGPLRPVAEALQGNCP